MRKFKTKNYPKGIQTEIEGLSHEGRGISRIEGKTTFIHGALPDETVVIDIVSESKTYDEGRVIKVLNSSNIRVEPPCPHYTRCGGCALQHMSTNAQIEAKEGWLAELFHKIGHVQPQSWLPPLKASTEHYRYKARLSVKYVIKKNATLIGFRERHNSRYIAEIDSCHILHPKLSERLPELKQLIANFSDPTGIAQIELSAGDSDIALIFRHLSPLTDSDKDQIIAFANAHNFIIYLQPGGFDTIERFYPISEQTYLSYQYDNIEYLFHPSDFTQINTSLNTKMLARALELLNPQPNETLLDLFCGLGNFTLPIARTAHHVIGIEGSETMVQRARMNAEHNNIVNTEFYALDLEKPDALMFLSQRHIDKMLIDPARPGAFEVMKQISYFKPKRIVYVSCNPATLARDADYLVNTLGYQLTEAGVMDMFPHTAHVESMAVFNL